MISKEYKQFLTSKMRELNDAISIIEKTVNESKRMSLKESSVIRSNISRCEQTIIDIFFHINHPPKPNLRDRIIGCFIKKER